MKHSHTALVLVAILTVPSFAAAQELSAPFRTAVLCAPRAASSIPGEWPRILGRQDTVNRGLYATRDLLVINQGTDKGVQLGQKFSTHHMVGLKYAEERGLRAVVTSGLVTVVAVNENTAIAVVDFACDGIDRGDVLRAWTEPAIPSDALRTDAGGELDFAHPARVLFGDQGKNMSGAGDLVIVDLGESEGVMPGSRFAVYRDVKERGVPLAAIGEAIVISVGEQTSLVRLTRARDAVATGDLLIPRRR